MASNAGISNYNGKPFPDYSSYYRDSFHLKCVVSINGEQAEVIFQQGQSYPHLQCKELNICSKLSERIRSWLFEYGVDRIKGFYGVADQSQCFLICVEFLSIKSVRRFLSNVNPFARLAFRDALKDSISKQVDIDIAVELYLACLSSNESTFTSHKVTLENYTECFQKWEQSKIAKFTSNMFETQESYNTGM